MCRTLPVCVLPSLTATDLQDVMKDVSYGTGANEYQLTEDQVRGRERGPDNDVLLLIDYFIKYLYSK